MNWIATFISFSSKTIQKCDWDFLKRLHTFQPRGVELKAKKCCQGGKKLCEVLPPKVVQWSIIVNKATRHPQALGSLGRTTGMFINTLSINLLLPFPKFLAPSNLYKKRWESQRSSHKKANTT